MYNFREKKEQTKKQPNKQFCTCGLKKKKRKRERGREGGKTNGVGEDHTGVHYTIFSPLLYRFEFFLF